MRQMNQSETHASNCGLRTLRAAQPTLYLKVFGGLKRVGLSGCSFARGRIRRTQCGLWMDEEPELRGELQLAEARLDEPLFFCGEDDGPRRRVARMRRPKGVWKS